MLFDKYD